MSTNWAKLAKEAGFYDEKVPPPQKKRVIPRKDADAKPEIVIFEEDRLLVGYEQKEFRRIPSYPDYYISQDGIVKNVDGQTLRRSVTSSGSQVSLRIGIRNKNTYKWPLIHEAWPEFAPIYTESGFVWRDCEWRYLENWPGYAISKHGEGLRLKNWTLLRDNQGRINMSKDGKQHSRAVRGLVFEEFGIVL